MLMKWLNSSIALLLLLHHPGQKDDQKNDQKNDQKDDLKDGEVEERERVKGAVKD